MVPKKTIHFKGKKTITIKTTNQEKVRVSLLLTITANGGKLPPLFIFKSKKGGTIEKSLKKYKEVINGNAFIACNENAWCTYDIMNIWLNEIWLPYIKKASPNGNGLVILDKCTSHIKEEFLKLLYDSNQNYCIIPARLTRVLQPLDVSINQPLKARLTQIYCDNCIKYGRNLNKIKREKVIDWILQIWKYEDKIISKEMIYYSFKYCGLSNSLDGSEKELIKVYDKIKEEVIQKDETSSEEDIEEEVEIEEEESNDSESDKEN